MRARFAASVAIGAAILAVLAGCNFITPVSTLKHYDPSDGISTKIGDIDIVNALVVSDDGVDGNLLFTAVNNASADAVLNVQYQAGTAKKQLTLRVPGDMSVRFGFGSDGQLLLTGIGAHAGSLLPIYFQYGSAQGAQLMVPVLNGSLGSYSTLTPTPLPTPTPTETLSPTPTPSTTP